MRRSGAVLAIALVIAACGGSESEPTATPSQTLTATQTAAPTAGATDTGEPTSTTPTPLPTVPPAESPSVGVPSATLVEAFPGLELPEDIVAMHQVPGSDMMVAVIRSGAVVAFPKGSPYGDPRTALDISGEVATGFELGLLSFAFDPDFETNRFVYLYYSVRDPALRTLVVRMTADVSSGQFTLDSDSGLTILAVEQPFGNHNGGTVLFGPDGMLYLGLGDGGAGGDPRGFGQDTRENLLGAVIRIDVSGATAAEPYTIPVDNPFVGDDEVLDETWAFGLRNPWRMAFDSATGELWVGDAGQDRLEEVDIIRAGENFGWNIMEGSACFEPSEGCDATGLTPPVAEYATNQGCAIIGGYVYRGESVPALKGQYIYGDVCSGDVWALDAASAAVGNPKPPIMLWEDGPGMFSFAVDEDEELYLLGTDNVIYRFAP